MVKKILQSYNYAFIGAIFLLCGIGVVMVYSASMVTAISRYGVPADYFFKKQLWALLAGFLAFVATSIMPYKVLHNLKVLKFLIFAAFVMLVAVLFMGHTAGNATSWIKLGPLTIQPLEISKLIIIVYLAAVFSNKQEHINHIGRSLIPPLIMVGLLCFLIALQPDYGGIMLIGFIVVSMMFSSGISIKSIFKILLLCVIAAVLMLIILAVTGQWGTVFSPVRLGRLASYRDPFADPLGEGYQLVNSYYAIAEGGLRGMGLGQGVQKAGYLPESHTDFIMAVVGEELGFWGVAIVLALIFFIVFKGLRIAQKCPDTFGSLLAIGISVMIGIQAFVNLGAVTGILPITGVPLPFMSYGGSSLTLLLAATGVLANVSMMTKFKEKYDKKKVNPARFKAKQSS